MSTARFEIIHNFKEFSGSPSARVQVENAEVLVALSDEDAMVRVSFKPYQAVRIMTADCFALSGEMFVTPRTIMEVSNSEWLDELKASLGIVDETATFLNESRHFLVPCDDSFIEIVAWRFDVLDAAL